MNEHYVNYKGRYKKKAPSRADHLKPYRWKKGQSGNPEGRPTGSISIVERLKAYLRRHPEEIEAIVLALVKEGRLGNLAATKEMLDRIDGKVVDTHKIEGEVPITIQFVPAEQILSVPAPTLQEGEDKDLLEVGD